MKKVLISAKNLKIGGIEKSLITLVDYLIENKNEVTLVLKDKEGELLTEINSKVKIIKYTPSSNKIKLFRKMANLLKRIKFIIKYRNKFDTSISYATYLKSGSFVARMASKNSILWCHADYLSLFKNDKDKMQDFFEDLYYEDFAKIIFVSKKAQETFLDVFPKQKNTYYCNNLVDYKKIYEQTEETIDINYDRTVTTFLNVGRHDENQKKLTRIIEAAKKLKNEKYKFRIIFVGDGEDTNKYKNLVESYKLQKNIIFVGAKENPYPYYKIANCVILSSDYEGYPVVFLESYILNKPIITTDVSDYVDIQKGRGIVVQKSEEGLYRGMKEFLENGYIIKNEFDIRQYNQTVKEQLDKIL